MINYNIYQLSSEQWFINTCLWLFSLNNSQKYYFFDIICENVDAKNLTIENIKYVNEYIVLKFSNLKINLCLTHNCLLYFYLYYHIKIISKNASFIKNLKLQNNRISVYIVKNSYYILVCFFFSLFKPKYISNIVHVST